MVGQPCVLQGGPGVQVCPKAPGAGRSVLQKGMEKKVPRGRIKTDFACGRFLPAAGGVVCIQNKDAFSLVSLA